MTDPVDRLRARNPAPPDDHAPVPMALADRIMREHRRSPRAAGWLVATSFASAVVAVGAIWLLWLGGGTDGGPVAIDTTTSSVATSIGTTITSEAVDVTTTAPVTATTSAPEAIDTVLAGQLLELLDIADAVESLNESWERRTVNFDETLDRLLELESRARGTDADGLGVALADAIDAVAVGLAAPDDGSMRRAGMDEVRAVRLRISETAVSLGADVEPIGLRIVVDGFGAVENDVRVDFRWPRLITDGDPTVADRINELILGYVGSLNPAAVDPGPPLEAEPGEYGLGYRVLLQTDRLLSIVFDEYGYVLDTVNPWTAARVFVFDLTDGSVVDLGEMLTDDGVGALAGLVQSRIDALAPGVTLAAGALVDDVAVAPGGLIAYVDEIDGLPHAVGTQGFPFTWRQIEGIVDAEGPLGSIDRTRCDGPALPLVDQAGLPVAVEITRAAIHAVAPTCDFATLSELTAPDGFRSSFGVVGDVEEFWIEREVLGERLMTILADTLNLSYGIIENPDGPDLYVWPSAATVAWDELTDGQIAELETISSPGEIAGYAEFGAFIGWRVGITENGEWQFFVAGD